MAKDKDKKQLIIGTVFSEWKHTVQELVKEHVSLAKSIAAHDVAKAFGEDYQPEAIDAAIQKFGRTQWQIERSRERCVGYAQMCYHWSDTFDFVVDLFDPEKELVNGSDYDIKTPKLLTSSTKKEISDGEIKKQLLKYMKQLCDKVNAQRASAEEFLTHVNRDLEDYRNSDDGPVCGFDPHLGQLSQKADEARKAAKEQRELNLLFKETYEYLLDNVL